MTIEKCRKVQKNGKRTKSFTFLEEFKAFKITKNNKAYRDFLNVCQALQERK